MTQRRDDLFSEIEDALSIEPSPEFEAKVRARVIERSPARRSPVLIFIAGLSVAALAGWVVWSRPAVPLAPSVSVAAPALARSSDIGSPAMPGSVQRLSSNRAAVVASRTAPGRPTPEPEVLTNQPAILRAIWARMSAETPVEEEPQVSAEEPKLFETSLIEVRPLKVAPIVIRTLDESDDKE